MRDLETLRKEIDRVDKDICALLGERFALVREIGAVKKEQGLPILNASREAVVLEKVRATAETEAEKDALAEVYKTIMIEAKKLEK